MSSAEFLPYNQPDIGDEEISAVVNTLKSGWLTSGPRTAEFERELRAYTGSPYALAVNSCTAGLHLALMGLDLQPGDEVITTPITFCSTVNTILQAGGTPVLADVGADLNIDLDAISAQVTERTRAILPVHYGGLPCRMEEIWQLAEDRNLKVIEDAAHALGAAYRATPIGDGRSRAVAFSFYATKNLCTGEGGMVTTRSSDVYERMRTLSLHGISSDAWNRYTEKGRWQYDVVACGFKYNMSDIASAIGIHQLHKLDRMNARRATIAATYNCAFADVREVELPPDRQDSVHAWHLYVLRLNLDMLSIDRARFFEEMRDRRIGCSVHFIPIPLHSYYRRMHIRGSCARALAEYPRLLSLPLYSKMTDDDVCRVIDTVRDLLYKFKKRTIVALAASN